MGGEVLAVFCLTKLCVCVTVCVMAKDTSYCSQGPQCLKATDRMWRFAGHYSENLDQQPG